MFESTRNVIDNVDVNNVFFIGKILTLKAIRSHSKRLYEKQNRGQNTFVIILYGFYETSPWPLK